MTKHTIKNPNIDRLTPEAPEEAETRQPARRGGEPERELEDDLGGDREPEMVPPGTVVEREDGDDGGAGDEMDEARRQPMQIFAGTAKSAKNRRGRSADTDRDPEALAADRAAARTSDRTDARDGVDASDMIERDPDAVGGKSQPH